MPPPAPPPALPPAFFVCSTCGSVVTVDASPGYRCPRRPTDPLGEGHRLVREFEPRILHWPELGPENPLLRYRHLTTPYLRYRLAGGSDTEYVEGIEDLESTVARRTDSRFTVARLGRSEALELATGRESGGAVFLQDRTRFAGGPGSWLGLLLAIVPVWVGPDRDALATFEPAADAADAGRLAETLGRVVHVSGGLRLGSEEVPWTAWRDLNAWVGEGEELWAFGCVDALRREGFAPSRVFLSADGGGAVAWVQGLRAAFRLGGLPALPRIHIVEEASVGCVRDLYGTILRSILEDVDERLTEPKVLAMAQQFPRVAETLADRIVAGLRSGEPEHPVRRAVERALVSVGAQRGSDLNHLNALCRAMLESGGFPIMVEREELIRGRISSRREPPGGRDAPVRRESGAPVIVRPAGARNHCATTVSFRSLPTPGLASAGSLRLFSHGELPSGEVVLVIDP